jgi:hypothetical protein
MMCVRNVARGQMGARIGMVTFIVTTAGPSMSVRKMSSAKKVMRRPVARAAVNIQKSLELKGRIEMRAEARQ